MRDQCEFHGLLVVEPPLTVEDVQFLDQLLEAQLYLAPIERQDDPPPPLPQLVSRPPSGVSGWASCGHGCCLWIDDAGHASVPSVVAWLRYLIRHYFGSAHTFDGVVVARDRYTTETTAVRVRDNVVERIRLSGPDPRYRGHWDEWADPSPPTERAAPLVASPEPGVPVIDLSSRRR